MLKVGDKLRILEDGPYGSELNAGDVVTVYKNIDDDGDFVVHDFEGTDWWLPEDAEGKLWELVVPAEELALVSVETVTHTVTEPVYVIRLSRYNAELLAREFAATPALAGGPLHHALVAALAND